MLVNRRVSIRAEAQRTRGGCLPNTPPSSHDSLVQHQPALLNGDPATTFQELDHLIRGREVQLPGQGSLQILLEELAMPAIPILKVHVDAMTIILGRHETRIGEQRAKRKPRLSSILHDEGVQDSSSSSN